NSFPSSATISSFVSASSYFTLNCPSACKCGQSRLTSPALPSGHTSGNSNSRPTFLNGPTRSRNRPAYSSANSSISLVIVFPFPLLFYDHLPPIYFLCLCAPRSSSPPLAQLDWVRPT